MSTRSTRGNAAARRARSTAVGTSSRPFWTRLRPSRARTGPGTSSATLVAAPTDAWAIMAPTGRGARPFPAFIGVVAEKPGV
jgi:hypothetical protein